MKHYVLHDVDKITHAESCCDQEEADDIAEIFKKDGHVNVRVLSEVEFKKFSEKFTLI